jgi:hypothetical protein
MQPPFIFSFFIKSFGFPFSNNTVSGIFISQPYILSFIGAKCSISQLKDFSLKKYYYYLLISFYLFLNSFK